MMKKRLLASLLAAAMTLTMAPAAFAAEGDNVQLNDASSAAAEVDPTVKTVAQVGDKEYTSLADAIEAVDNGGQVTILNDVTEDVVIPEGKIVTLYLNGQTITNSTGHTITNNGQLAINGTGTIDNVTNGKAAVYNAAGATCNLNGEIVYSRSAEASTSESSGGGNSYYVIDNVGTMNIHKGTFKFSDTNNGAFSSLIHNGWYDGSKNTSNHNAVMTIWDGDFTQGTGGKITVKNDDYGELDIQGGVFTQPESSYYCVFNYNKATISGGTINGHVGNEYINDTSDKGHLDIHGDAVITGDIDNTTAKDTKSDEDNNLVEISGDVKIDGSINTYNAANVVISGGNFNFDPSDYLAESSEGGKKYVATATKGDYAYKVELVDNSVVPAVPTTGANTAPNKDELAKNTDIDKASVEAVANAAKEVAVDSKEISEQAQNAAADLSDDDNQKKTFEDAAKGEVPDVEKIEVRSHIDVVPKAFNNEKYTLDITPKIDIVVVGKKEDGTAAEKVVDTKKLTIAKSTTVNIPLPASFIDRTISQLFVQHKGYEYEATVSEDNGAYIATFENPHGFSEFTITKNSQTAAKIKDVCYTKFEDAATAAKDNETVYVIGSDTEYKATISGASKTIKVENGKDKDITVTINNTVKTIKPQETAEFTYTKPSSSGSSGGSASKTTYKVTTSSVANGGVNVSPSSSAKGDKVKITLSPNKGYKLDKLTVTDASGKTVSTTKTSDTVYTFTMPASQVTVGVTYVKADETTEQPSTKTFSDVSSSDWFADAVKYVSDKGMMNGTGNGKFSPADSTTRGMLMTVIARYAGQDTTGSNPWYQKGMEWAKANGVSDGTEPNANITREQLVTMLYRYAKASGKDVSVGEDTNILSYADATTVSQYAIPAMQWACGAGIINGANGKLNPQNNATRAEVAAILMRFCENVK